MNASDVGRNEIKSRAHDTSDQMLSIVLFRRAWGFDPEAGQRVFQTRHRVLASAVNQDSRTTHFVNSDGEIVADFPTRMIRTIEWPNQYEERVAFLKREGKWDSYVAKIRRFIPNAYMPWTPEQDKKLRDLFEVQCSIDEIGKTLGRGSRGVEYRLTALGLPVPVERHAALTEDLSISTIRSGKVAK